MAKEGRKARAKADFSKSKRRETRRPANVRGNEKGLLEW